MVMDSGMEGGENARSNSLLLSIRSIFKHADALDCVLMAVGCLGAIFNGLSQSILYFLLAQVFNVVGMDHSSPDFIHKMNFNAAHFLYLGAGSFVAAFLEGYCCTVTAERQASRMRALYLKAVMRQDVGYFDVKMTTSEVIDFISNDTLLIQDVLSEKTPAERVKAKMKVQLSQTCTLLNKEFCCIVTAERQASRMRALYLKAVMRQDVGYFDVRMTTSEVIDFISNDTLLIQDVLSEKAPNFIMNCSSFLGSYIVAVVLLWQLALVAFPSLLLLIIPGLIYGRILRDMSSKIQVEYNKAGIIVEQALSAIRTVYSSTAELYITSAFSAALDCSLRLGLRQDLVKGLAIGSNNVIFAIFAFIFWYGSRLVQYEGAKGGTIIVVGLCIVRGGQALGTGLSDVKNLVEAIMVGEKMMKVITRRPVMDSESNKGGEIGEVVGEVEFKEVRFSYPARPDTQVFEGLSLRVEAGKMVAIVGESGSGKSTIISLLQRFYDPTGGEILLDKVNIKNLRLNWLRAHMGLVSQEPVLFAISIKENILFGKEDATMEEVVAAAKAANAHEFISHLPLRYDTQVGERGIQLSGGEKQRIAIARALIRSPKILLLDEATSTLDAVSELVVQEALHNASIGRTTIIIAHRLSTVRNSDTILVIQSGQVIESGSHDHLISFTNGHYSYLVRLQEPQQCIYSIEVNSAAASPHSNKNHNFNCSPRHYSSSRYSMDLQDNYVHNEEKIHAPSFWQLLLLSKPEWRHVLLGCVCAALIGLPNLLYAFCLSGILTNFLDKDKSNIATITRIYCLILLAMSVLAFVIYVLKDYSFSIMGQYLTKRVRESMLSKMLTFEVAWFDQEKNSTGVIYSKITKDARVIQSLVVDRLSLMIQMLSIVLSAYIIALVISWKLALVIISAQSIVVACYYTKSVLLKQLLRKRVGAQSDGNRLAMEAVQNIRTITAFSSQDHILHLFMLTLVGPRQLGIRHSWVAGTLLGCSQGIGNCFWALTFWYGGILLSNGSITVKAFLQIVSLLFRTSRVIADAGAMTTDLTTGTNSAAIILSILERVTLIDPDYHEGHRADSIKGGIELRDVSFSYPSRPEALVLKHFSVSFPNGQPTALVGPSGSGKSTIISLIERFYDPRDGEVLVNGLNIKTYHLRSLRRRIALVGQEPTLFVGTIKENIRHGVEEAGDAEVEAAARTANAHDFISGMKDGYDTICGEKGVQLSGGQKQRVAIARAVLRNPSILLLDEATSALDGEVEKLVQEALERAMRGRTTVVVAHRLSTIRNCDLIVVLENGRLVEKGNHDSLMEMGHTGKYYGLVNLQLRQEKMVHLQKELRQR